MSEEVGRVALGLELTDRKLETQMNRMMSGIAKKAAAALAAAFSVKAVTRFGKQCIELGSDLAEVQNVVDVTFPSLSAKVDQFAQSAASSFGLSETMAKKFTGTFGSMAEAFGFSEQAAYEMSTTLTGLAGDVASFYNISQDEAYTKLKSVFSGETETLKDLGIVMTQTALDSYALANGFGKTTAKMSDMEKVPLRYAFVLDQLANATGDFSRTQDSWANQSRVLALQAQSAMAAVGQGLINLLTPALQALNQVMGRVTAAAQAFRDLTAAIMGSAGQSVAGNLSRAGDYAKSLGDNLTAACQAGRQLDGVTGVAAKSLSKGSKAAETYRRSLEGFDQITKVSSQDSAGSSSGGGSGGSGGSGSGAGDLAGTSLSPLTTGAEAAEGSVSKLSGALKRLADFVNSLDFGPLQGAWDRLSGAAQKFGGILSGALNWGLEHVLAPLAKWTVEEAAPAVVNLLASALEVLNSACEALAPAAQWIWDNFLEPIAAWTGGVVVSVLETLTGALGGLSNWIDQHQAAISNAAIAAGAFAAAWAAGQSIIGIVAGIAGALGTVGTAISTFQTALGMASSIGALFQGVLMSLGGAFAPVIAAVAAAVAVGVLLYKNWDTVCQWAGKLFAAIEPAVTLIRDSFTTALENLQGPLNTIKEAFGRVKDAIVNDLLPTLKTDLLPLWDILKAALMTVAGVLGGVFATALAGVTGVINGIISAISGFAAAISGCVAVITGAFNLIVGIFSGNGELCIESLNSILDGAIRVFSGLPGAVSGFLQGFVDGVVGFFRGLWDTLVGHSIVPDTINGVVNCFSGLWDGVSGFVSSFVDGVTSAFTSAKDWVVEKAAGLKDGAVAVFGTLQESAGTIWENIKTGASEKWEAIKTTVGEKASALKEGASSAFSTLKENVSNAASKAKETASNAWSGLKKNTSTIFTSVKNAAGKSWDGIKAAVSKATDGTKSAVSKAWDSMKTTTSKTQGSIKTTVSGAWNNVKSVTSTAWNGVKTAVSNPISSIKSTIYTGLNGAKSTVTTVWNGIKSATAAAWNGVKTAVSGPVNAIKSTISTGLSSAKSTAATQLDGIKSKFSSVFSGAKSTVSSAISYIKSKMNFKWSLPKLKLPHFKVKGKFGLNPPSVPTFSIQWYKKAMNQPVMVNRPTLFGAGEAGPEVVAGAQKLKSMIAEAVRSAAASSGVPVDVRDFVQRNTPRLAAVSSSTPGETDHRRQTSGAAQSPQDTARLEELLKAILKLLQGTDLVRLDPESLRRYFIRQTNRNTDAAGYCELRI